MHVKDWSEHLTDMAMLKDTRERLDGIIATLLEHGTCFAIETSVPAGAGETGEWYIWTTARGGELLLEIA